MKNMFNASVVVLALITTVAAQAQEAGVAHVDSSAKGMMAIAAAIAIGLAVLGGATGQGKAAAAFLEGIARNPSANDKMFIPLILSLAFIESLVLFAFLISFLIK